MAILKDEEMGEMRIALEQMTKERNSLQEKIDKFIKDANDDLRIKLVLMKRPEEANEAALQKWD
jgi:predicted nucleotide-binding protein (sugar kinase/HSP70/actin superfamily)